MRRRRLEHGWRFRSRGCTHKHEHTYAHTGAEAQNKETEQGWGTQKHEENKQTKTQTNNTQKQRRTFESKQKWRDDTHKKKTTTTKKETVYRLFLFWRGTISGLPHSLRSFFFSPFFWGVAATPLFFFGRPRFLLIIFLQLIHLVSGVALQPSSSFFFFIVVFFFFF
eukprot:TRINITY_DN2538_c1_g1_i2.p1 TRINITY_DN2538_c1_g1~~TRINITY_DN2538_c1_g1_i2.p1  ORF type:complete len:167 (-),score=2.57 TRINITY_DN2538_c1_g1_i2:64-564(-)